MSHRNVMKVFCAKKNHPVGHVQADTDAGVYVIQYTAALSRSDGSTYPSDKEVEDPLLRDQVATATAYCKTCERPVMLNYGELLRKVDEGARHHHAPFADTIDKAWRKAGREPIYPPRRREPPSSNT